MGKFGCENCLNCCLVVGIVRKLYEDNVGADIGVLGRVDANEVLALDEYWAVFRRQRSEGETALKVSTRRGMVEIDGVGLENVAAVRCGGG